MNKVKLLAELQSITGMMTDNAEYMMYQILKDGTRYEAFKKKEASIDNKETKAIREDTDLDKWFNQFKDV